MHGGLHLPLKQEIPTQSYLKLKENGGYMSQDSDRYRLEGVVSFGNAYSQVTGHEENKPGHGWVTLATSVVEKLNVLEVVTADRVVAQVSTEHPREGYVPKITFLGSRFENLRIAGHPVDVTLEPHLLWDDSEHLEAVDRDKRRASRIADLDQADHHQLDLPGDLPASYPEVDEDAEVDPAKSTRMRYSLVTHCSFPTKTKYGYPGECKQHVIDIPHFGRIFLANVCIEHSQYKTADGIPKQTIVKLSMIKLKLGCLATGMATVATTRTNGGSHP